MQNIAGMIGERARALLRDGTVARVLGFQGGEFFYDRTPAVFESDAGLETLVYDGFCAANVSKYLIGLSRRDGKTLALLKPCDTYGLNQLIREHRVDRDRVYALGVACGGMLDIEKIRARARGVLGVTEHGDTLTLRTANGGAECARRDVLLDKCLCCKGSRHMIADEVVTDGTETPAPACDRFDGVRKIEAMSADERFSFFRGELSKCIRCNACRNICPLCSCEQCVFDNDRSGVASKANSDPFEENLFHIIRSFHVAGRCTDCGECSRVCPQHIPLHLLNRKYIKDIDTLYGEFQAGADADARPPLLNYTKQDAEPGVDTKKGGAR